MKAPRGAELKPIAVLQWSAMANGDKLAVGVVTGRLMTYNYGVILYNPVEGSSEHTSMIRHKNIPRAHCIAFIVIRTLRPFASSLSG